jgi:hypothetical protein
MNLVGIKSAHVDTAWPLVERWVQRATDESPHFSPEDIREACKLKEMSLWALVSGGDVVGCLVTTIVIWPQIKVARLVVAAAEDGFRDDWMKFRPIIEDWARSYGCELVEVYGRPGWAKVIPGARARACIEWRV